LTIKSDKDSEFLQSINAYTQNNVKYSRDIFIKEMSTHISVIIKNVETKITELNSKVKDLSIAIEKIKEGTSNNAKNKFKQLNNEYEFASKKKKEKEIEMLKDFLNKIKN
jgi:hypothetical protein